MTSLVCAVISSHTHTQPPDKRGRARMQLEFFSLKSNFKFKKKKDNQQIANKLTIALKHDDVISEQKQRLSAAVKE